MSLTTKRVKILDSFITFKTIIIIASSIYVSVIAIMFDDGVFWGLIGIALAIVGLGVPYLVTLRRRTTEMQTLIDSLSDMAIGQVYEKIAVLEEYIDEVSTWKNKKVDTGSRTNKICYDIRSMWRIVGRMSPEQRTELSSVIRRLIERMEKEDYQAEAGRVRDASAPLGLTAS